MNKKRFRLLDDFFAAAAGKAKWESSKNEMKPLWRDFAKGFHRSGEIKTPEIIKRKFCWFITSLRQLKKFLYHLSSVTGK